MKIEKKYLKFPKSLPNDLEDFLVFYPKKFPSIVRYYEEVAEKVADNPEEFRRYGDWAKEELWKGFEKIKNDYENGNKENLGFLVETDQRFNKLICFRFWVVNYLFADGPLHDYFVDSLRNLVYKMVDAGESTEEFEQKISSIQRDLLQGSYADLYLQQALSGERLLIGAKQNKLANDLIEKAEKIIHENPADRNELKELWDNLIELAESEGGDLLATLEIPLQQAKMRGSIGPVYNMLTHAVEFKDENHALALRHEEMRQRVEDLKTQAKSKLSSDEYELFEISIAQIQNFTEYKDVMGEIDTVLLPLWFSIHDRIFEILKNDGVEIEKTTTGHCALFYFYVWYLPDNLKAKVMTVDNSEFNLKIL
ncbi:MAG TPA: hypothetical protein VF817_03185 [Patescibacteria group bacterium]